MKQAIILVQTILLFLLPSGAGAFNKSLGSVPPSSNELGKVIKEIVKESNPYQIKTIVIDPGHGGHDPGCSGSSSREKHLALGIGKRLKVLINQNFPEIKVLMTRDKDVFIPLHKRAALANRNKADLFISIHCNFMPGSSATRGTETYVMGLHKAEHNLNVAKRENAAILLEEDYEKNYDYDPNSTEGHIMLTMFQSAYLSQSILFAEKAEKYMKEIAGRRSRGVKQAGFVVLKETTMPSVLVEAGFLSNENEQNFLKTEAGQMRIAKGLLKAFKEYKNTIESPEYLQFSRPAPEVAKLPATEKKEVQQYNVPKETSKKKESLGLPPGVYGPVPKTTTVKKEPKKVFTNVYKSTSSSPKIEERKTPAKDLPKIGIQFFVQLSASSKLQNTSEGKWTQIGYPVEVVKENNMYKYRARNFKNLKEAQEARKAIQLKGFPDAFLVAYKNGERVALAKAYKELGIQ